MILRCRLILYFFDFDIVIRIWRCLLYYYIIYCSKLLLYKNWQNFSDFSALICLFVEMGVELSKKRQKTLQVRHNCVIIWYIIVVRSELINEYDLDICCIYTIDYIFAVLDCVTFNVMIFVRVCKTKKFDVISIVYDIRTCGLC